MKFSTLSRIVILEAHRLKENAGYSGAWNDGGSGHLLGKLDDFKNELVIREDLRPSEFHLLNDMEIGEPEVFSDVIKDYKRKLADEIVNKMKL